MMFITRSLVAALVIVGTVALSLGASFGVSVLVWQHLLGVELYWVILPLAVILLLAVGSDYNLLLVSRFKEEIHACINTGKCVLVAIPAPVPLATGEGRCVMAEPAKKRATYEEHREESVEDILAAARPLPPLEEMMIEDLTEEEARAFYEAIDNL
jgi:hypothetical protein